MTTSVTTDDLLKDLRALVRDAESLLRETATYAGEHAAEARVRAEESLQNARVRLSEFQDNVVVKARDVVAETDTYVRNKPFESIGIAAGIGILIGLLLHRRD